MKTKLSLLPLVLLSACASVFDSPGCANMGDDYCWFKREFQRPATTYKWVTMDAMKANLSCNYPATYVNASCVKGINDGIVLVHSALTIKQAKQITDGQSTRSNESIFCHEVDKHGGLNECGNNPTRIQWLHNDNPRPIFYPKLS